MNGVQFGCTVTLSYPGAKDFVDYWTELFQPRIPRYTYSRSESSILITPCDSLFFLTQWPHLSNRILYLLRCQSQVSLGSGDGLVP